MYSKYSTYKLINDHLLASSTMTSRAVNAKFNPCIDETEKIAILYIPVYTYPQRMIKP